MRRLGRALGWAVAVVAVVVGGRGLALLAAPPSDAEAIAGLRWLAADLDGHADRMQAWFPEGRVFTLALVGIAWSQVGAGHPALADEAAREVRRALALATDAASRSTFAPTGDLPHGMFYASWTGRLHVARADLAAARGEPVDTTALARPCRRLADALDGPAVFPDSYPGAAWPADAVVGAATLAGCGDYLGGAYRDTAEAWLARALARADPETGLLPHDALGPDPRGSSSALMVPFVAEIDPAAAQAQYRALRRTFATRMLGVVPAVREYPRGVAGRGDVDSGPVVLGVSAPATVVGIAAARATGDATGAEALRTATEAVGVPVTLGGRRRYGLGALPVGDAFLAWAATVPTAGAGVGAGWTGWRGRWGAASGLGLALGLGLAVGLWRSRR